MNRLHNLSPEFWAIVSVGAILALKLNGIERELSRIRSSITDSHIELQGIEMHLAASPWVREQVRRDETYTPGD